MDDADIQAIQEIINTTRVRLANIERDLVHMEGVIHATTPNPTPNPAPNPTPSPANPSPTLPPAPGVTMIASRLTQLYRSGGEGPLMAFAVHQMFFGSEIPAAGPPSQSAVLPFYRDVFGWDGQNPDSPEGIAKRQWVNSMDQMGYAGASWWPALHANPFGV